MPIIGLGTWTQDDDTAESSVYEALKDGYRLIDTAQYYGNETGVGKGIQRAIDEEIVTREEVFVTTKVMPSMPLETRILTPLMTSACGQMPCFLLPSVT